MRSGAGHIRWFAVVGVSALTACSALVDFHGLAGTGSTEGEAGGDANGAELVDGAVVVPDGSSSDDASSELDGTTPVDGSSTFMCPAALHGPALVVVDTYCIDQTEVTNKQYAAFLAAGVGLNNQPAFCSWNGTYMPSCGAIPMDDAPVACVDWCDANAFCKWAGKRLCGRIGGGSVDKAGAGNASAGQWYRACSLAGTRAFPYGNGYVSGTCNDFSMGMTGTVTVGSLSKCVGGYPGIFDMNGNVNEWEDSCDGTLGASDMCLIRGGAFDDSVGSGNLGCGVSTNAPQTRTQADPTVGIRCCAP